MSILAGSWAGFEMMVVIMAVVFPIQIIATSVRRHLTDRFPYGVVYLVEPDYVWIVAVMHLHREPGYWHKRLG